MLILWRYNERPEDRGDDMPCDAFRSVFAIGRWYVGLFHQFRTKSDGRWNTSHTDVYSLGLARKPMFGVFHAYYDGPHCMLSLGWLRIQWIPRGGWCTKCMPDDEVKP